MKLTADIIRDKKNGREIDSIVVCRGADDVVKEFVNLKEFHDWVEEQGFAMKIVNGGKHVDNLAIKTYQLSKGK